MLDEILKEIDGIYVDDTDFGVECNMEGRSNIPCDNCYECIKNACKDIIRKHVNDGWIPVEERLPENEDEVLVSVDTGHVFTGYYSDGEWYVLVEPDYPVAWMPLPVPYMKKRNE